MGNKTNLPVQDWEKQLGNIQRVEASAFLFTRIQERIKHEQVSHMPAIGVWSFSFILLIILALNASVIQEYTKSDLALEDSLEELFVIEDFNLYN